jgi:6-phosphofructokinase 1
MDNMAIGILTSGGDCAGMNPAIKHFVDYCFELNLESYLIYDGLEGLIDNKIKKSSHDDVAGILHEGGTMLRSSRSKRFFEYKYRQQAFENLKTHNIDKLIVLGGDGSFRALNVFYNDFNIPFVGIPSTIDNDIYGTEYCLGVDTALNMIRVSIDAIRDTSSSFQRGCVVETMGRDCGYLALVSSITSGAEICIISELQYDLDSLKEKLKTQIQNGRNYIVCVISEGVKKTTQIVNWLEHDVGIETRATILGHIQRGGNPTVYDRLMAVEFVTYALDKLVNENNQEGSVVVYQNSKFEFKTIEEVTSNKYQINPNLLKMAARMTH